MRLAGLVVGRPPWPTASRSIGIVSLVTLVLVLAAGCGGSGPFGPDAPQGIEGIALRGPTCPVISETEPCEPAPHEADVVVLSDARWVTEFRTGMDGRFRVGLPAGSYRLVPESGDPFPVASALAVEVEPGRYTEVTIHFDTGIR